MNVRKLDGFKMDKIKALLYLSSSFAFIIISILFLIRALEVRTINNDLYVVFGIFWVLSIIGSMCMLCYWDLGRDKLKGKRKIYDSFHSSIEDYFEKDIKRSIKVMDYFVNPLLLSNPSVFILFGSLKKVQVYIQEAPKKSEGMIYEVYVDENEEKLIYRYNRFSELKDKLYIIFGNESINMVCLHSFSKYGIYDDFSSRLEGKMLIYAMRFAFAAGLVYLLNVILNIICPQSILNHEYFQYVVMIFRAVISIFIIYIIAIVPNNLMKKDGLKTYSMKDLIYHDIVELRIEEYLNSIQNERLMMIWVKCNDAIYCLYRENHTVGKKYYSSIVDTKYDRYFIYELDSNMKAECHKTIESFKDALTKMYPDGMIRVVDIYGIYSN